MSAVLANLSSLPNALSALRIACVPVLLALAWAGRPEAFLLGLVLALATDVADGLAARLLDRATELGARLDSLGDLLLYAALPICVWWLWPEAMRAEAAVVGIALGAFAVPTLVGLARWGRLTSYHTWGAKLSSWLVAGGVLLLVLLGEPALFRLAVSVLVVSALEELAITAALPELRSDVPTLRHALRLRAAARERTR